MLLGPYQAPNTFISMLPAPGPYQEPKISISILPTLLKNHLLTFPITFVTMYHLEDASPGTLPGAKYMYFHASKALPGAKDLYFNAPSSAKKPPTYLLNDVRNYVSLRGRLSWDRTRSQIYLFLCFRGHTRI